MEPIKEWARRNNNQTWRKDEIMSVQIQTGALFIIYVNVQPDGFSERWGLMEELITGTSYS